MICPLKPGFECAATVNLAIESKCDCPGIPQYELFCRRYPDKRIAPLVQVQEASA
jgi:hypothetical protein